MLMEIAFSRPRLRGNRLGSAAVWDAAVVEVVVKLGSSSRSQNTASNMPVRVSPVLYKALRKMAWQLTDSVAQYRAGINDELRVLSRRARHAIT